MKMIVTGAGGLLGRRLVAAARRAGHATIGMGRAAQVPAGLECERWIPGDLADPALAALDWTNCRGAPVFHLAGDTRIYDTGKDFRRDALAASATACAIARQTGGRLVLFSSAAVYSGRRTRRPALPLRETDETDPISAYGAAKLAAENLVRQSGVDAVVLRLFGVLSEDLAELPDRGNLIQAILRARAAGAEVTLATDEHHEPMIRDYVLDEDVCRCALAALAWPLPPTGPLVVNLCTGEATSTEAMVRLANHASGSALRARLSPSPASVSPVLLGDPTLLRRLLGWTPANRTAEFWTRFQATPAPVPGSSQGAAEARAPR